MKSAIGLFENEKAAEKAVDKLQKMGVDPDSIEIQSGQTIKASKSITAIPGGGFTSTQTTGVPGANPTNNPAAGGFIMDDNVSSFLSGKGVDGPELAFFVRGLQNTGVLVVVTEDSDHSVEELAEALTEAGGKTSSE